jgi:hypothetical protein
MTPGMPPRDWHMDIKEFVRQRMYSEMEPIRVDLAMLAKQVQVLDVKTQQVALVGSQLPESEEKKLGEILSPKIEAWVEGKLQGLQDTNSRLSHAEGVLRELGALHDKFALRHDSLVECLQDLDKRVEQIDGLVVANKQMDMAVTKLPSGGMAPHPSAPRPGVKELVPLPGEYQTIPPPQSRAGFAEPIKPPFGEGGHARAASRQAPVTPSSASRGASGGNVWTANDHEAYLQVKEFTFSVNRIAGVSLGMVLRDDGSKLVIDKINEGITLPVCQGDRIVAIDQIRGDSKKLLELIRRTGQLAISCQRLLSTSL